MSPDGDDIAFVVRWGSGTAIVLVPAVGGPERILTAGPTPVAGRGMSGGCFDWLPDGTGVVYAATDGELWLQPAPGGVPRRLTQQGRAAQAPVVAPDGTFVVYVVDQAEIWRCWVDRVVAAERLDDGTADFCFDPFVTQLESTALWTAWNVPDMPWDAARVGVYEFETGRVGEFVGATSVHQPRTLPDGRGLGVRDDHGWLNVWVGDEPLVDEPFEHAGPTWGFGQRSYEASPDGSLIAFTRNEHGFGRLCVADVSTGAVTEVARGVHGHLTWRGSRLAAIRSGASTPTQIVVYDGAGSTVADRSWTRTVIAVGPVSGWEAADLPEPELVELDLDLDTADPAVTLHARRYVAGQGRTICWIHGGPTDQWQVEFLPRVAYWWAQGWDILVPDPRGTTGHGRDYQQALRGGWGKLDVDDTASVLRHSHRAGWSTPERTVVMGGSSGGLTTLGLLGLQPGLAAGGVVLYPVTDLADLSARSHRFEAHYTVSLVGPLDDEDLYRERSPLSYADLIDVPLLVMHGDQDPVVPIDQSEALVDTIRGAGGEVTFQVMEGEGHGFRSPEHKLLEYRLIADFLSGIVRRGDDERAGQ